MIAPIFVEEALECLRHKGLPYDDLLMAVGLPPQLEAPISAQTYGALWLAITNRMGDEFFGLGGRTMLPGTFTLIGHSVLHAGSLRRALPRALRFLGVTIVDPHGELVVADGLAQFVLRDAGQARSAFAYNLRLFIAPFANGRRKVRGNFSATRALSTFCPRPDPLAENARGFAGPLPERPGEGFFIAKAHREGHALDGLTALRKSLFRPLQPRLPL